MRYLQFVLFVINVLLAVQSWFEIWFFTLWQERRLKVDVDGTMVLRRVFGTEERNNGS